MVLLFVEAQRAYPVPYELGRVLRVLACAGSVIAAGMFLQPGGLWAEIFVAMGLSAVFLAMIPLLSLLEPREQEVILQGLKGLVTKVARGRNAW